MLSLSAGAAGPPDGENGPGQRAAAHQPQRASRLVGVPSCEMLPVSAGAAGLPDGEDGPGRRAAAHQPQRASRHAHPKPLEVAALTISDAVLCSEMGVHFSPCGRLLAACVACQVSALTLQPPGPTCGSRCRSRCTA